MSGERNASFKTGDTFFKQEFKLGMGPLTEHAIYVGLISQ